MTPREIGRTLARPWLPVDPDVEVEGVERGGRPVHLRWEYAVWVAVGGFLGTGVRQALSLALPPGPDQVNWSILSINVTGAFLLAALLELLAGRGADQSERGRRRTLRLLVGTGVLGGYTTYSTFAVGAADLERTGHSGMSIGYCGLTVVVGLIASFAGFTAVARMRDRGWLR